MRTNRQFVMLAEEYDEAKHRSAGMWMSEKLDGQRVVWIPETIGMPITSVPFANIDKKQKEFISTGLWSRYGNPIMCPKWFTEGWPQHCLDGELWIGRKTFDQLRSAISKHIPIDSEWQAVKMYIFEKPHYDVLFKTGRVNETQFKKQFDYQEIAAALKLNGPPLMPGYHNTFDFVYRLMERDFKPLPTLVLHKQEQLPFNTPAALEQIARKLDEVTDDGGEGLILRHPGSEYDPIRSKFLLKIKKLHDAEATVIGYRAGTGKYAGMLGSLRVQWDHGTFELSGMDDASRVLTSAGHNVALTRASELLPVATAPDMWSCVFPVGTVVTFRYRELTPDKMPKEGRFLRKWYPDGGAEADNFKLLPPRGNA